MAISFVKWSAVFGLAIITGFTTHRHPMYVSVTEIGHNPSEKTLEISCKMFTDDLEGTLNKLYNVQLDLSSQADSVRVSRVLADYIHKHLIVKTDGHVALLKLIGFEKENGGTWAYLQAGGILAVKKVEVADDLLYESFEAQMGLLHVTINNKRQSARLNNPDKNATFNF